MQLQVHEIGHALGLAHSSVYDSIMFPYYQGKSDGFALGYDDILAVYQLYSKKSIYRYTFLIKLNLIYLFFSYIVQNSNFNDDETKKETSEETTTSTSIPKVTSTLEVTSKLPNVTKTATTPSITTTTLATVTTELTSTSTQRCVLIRFQPKIRSKNPGGPVCGGHELYPLVGKGVNDLQKTGEGDMAPPAPPPSGAPASIPNSTVQICILIHFPRTKNNIGQGTHCNCQQTNSC